MFRCCRGTPREALAAKMLDILSFANFRLTQLGIPKLLHSPDLVTFEVFSKTDSTQLGLLTFTEIPFDKSYLIYFSKSEDTEKRLVCIINAYSSSKKIGFNISESLEHM